MQQEQHKSYYAIIPANVRYDKELSPNAKLLYGEITALCNYKGFCWASNSYFAELYGVEKKTVSRWISLLEKCGYIKTELKYKENSQEIENRYIFIVDPLHEKTDTPIHKKVDTPTPKKVEDNNTVINNTTSLLSKDNNKVINKNIVGETPTSSKNTKKPLQLFNKPYITSSSKNEVEEVIEYLNKITGKNYKTQTASTNKLILARLNEGYTVEDMKKVIEHRWKLWKGTDIEQYVRPSTLFRPSNFESYVNSLNVRRNNNCPDNISDGQVGKAFKDYTEEEQKKKLSGVVF